MSSPPAPGNDRPDQERPSQQNSPILWHPAREWLEEDDEDDADFEPGSEFSEDRDDFDDGAPLYGDPDSFGIYLGMAVLWIRLLGYGSWMGIQ